MTAVIIQHNACLQSTLRKKKIKTLFAGLGRSVLGETVPSVLNRAQGRIQDTGTVFSNTDLPAGK